MQTFKQFFSEDDSTITYDKELPAQEAKGKVDELLALINQINRAIDTAQNEIESQTYTRSEAETLKQRIAALSKDLEGTRLPPEAEGQAGRGFTKLSKLHRDNTEYSTSIAEAIEIFKHIVSSQS
tara:strand:- start:515 stop:889 length:375 start_codon:yes stop_codon:yes gene_type:complete